MNKIYRVVWNAELGQWVVASEVAKGRKKQSRTSSNQKAVMVSVVGATLMWAGSASAQYVTSGGLVVCQPYGMGQSMGTQGGYTYNELSCTNNANGGEAFVLGNKDNTYKRGNVSPDYSTAFIAGYGDGTLKLRGTAGIQMQSQIFMNNNRISGLAEGIAGTDAVNVNQLNRAISTVSSGTTTDPTAIHYDTTTKDKATLAGTAGTTLTNLKDGAVAAGSKDAVTGNQLFSTNQNVTNLTNNYNTLNTTVANTNRYFKVAGGANDGTDDAKTGSAGSIAIGRNANATYNTVAIGDGAKTGYIDNMAVGTGADAGGGASIAVGTRASTISAGGYNFQSALGAESKSEANLGTALGGRADAKATNSVALGANSVSDRANTVSVGSADATTGFTRQIANVGKGTLDNDAVNVSQLKGVTTAFGGGSAVNADGSIKAPTYTVNGTTYNDVGSAITAAAGSAGNVDALKWNPTTGAYDAAHGTATTGKIANVADGTMAAGSKDAVNGGQLYTVDQKATAAQTTINNIANGAGIKYFHVNSGAADSAATGGESVAIGGGAKAVGAASIALGNNAQNVTGANNSLAIGGDSKSGDKSVTIGNGADTSTQAWSVAVGTNSKSTGQYGVAIGGSASVSGANSIALGANSIADRANSLSVGTTTMQRQVVNVAKGTLDNDAVNVSQLKGVTTAFGGGSSINADGSIKAPTYTVNGTTYNDVGSAITAAAGSSGNVDALKWNPTTGAYDAAHGTATSSKITDVADGTLAAGSKDAVTGGQLYTTNQNVANVTSTVNNITNGGGIKYVHVKSTSGDSVVNGVGSVAIGGGSRADGNGSVSIGESAFVPGSGTDDVAIGRNAKAELYTTNSVVLGADSYSNRNNSVSIGKAGGERQLINLAKGTADTDGVNVSQLKGVTTALGGDAAVNADGTVKAPAYDVDGTKYANVGGAVDALDGRIDTLNTALSSDLKYIKFGTTTALDASATGTDALAIGGYAQSLGTGALAIGANSRAMADNAVAIGAGSSTSAANTFAVGSTTLKRRIVNVADGVGVTDAVTVGQMNTKIAEALNSTTLKSGGTMLKGSTLLGATVTSSLTPDKLIVSGPNGAATTPTDAIGDKAIAMGLNSHANANNAVAAGQNVSVLGANGVGVGQNIAVGGVSAVAIGATVSSVSDYATAIGSDGTEVNTGATGAVAIGRAVSVGGAGTVGIGSNIIAAGKDAIVLGSNSSDDARDNVVSVGSAGTVSGTTAIKRQVVNVKAGTLDTDAVNVSQLKGAVAGLGGGAAVNTDGTVKAPSYAMTNANTIAGTTGAATDAGSALGKVDTALGNLNTTVGSINTTVNNITNGGGIKYFHVSSTAADSTTTGTESIGIGGGAKAVGAASIALGNNAQNVTGSNNSLAIGGDSKSSDKSVTIGNGADTSTQAWSVAVGTNAKSTGQYGVAIGGSASVTGANSIALGANSIADRANTLSVGTTTSLRQVVNVAKGTLDNDAVNVSQLKGVTTAFGGGSAVNADGSIKAPTYTVNGSTYSDVGSAINAAAASAGSVDALKWNATSGTYDAAHGAATTNRITNVADGAMAAGSKDAVNGGQLYTVDQKATAAQTTINNISNGAGIKYYHVNSTLADSAATGTDSVAVGPAAKAQSTNTVAIGNGATAQDGSTVSVGGLSQAVGSYSVALGTGAKTTLGNSVALGSNSSVTAANSVALGDSSLADRANAVSVGKAGAERQVMNMAKGTADTDAVNVSQLKGVAAAIGGGAAVNADGTIKAPSYAMTNTNTIAGTTGAAPDAGSALGKVDTALGNLNTSVNTINTTLTNTNRYFKVAGGANNGTDDAKTGSAGSIAIGRNANATYNTVAIGDGAKTGYTDNMAVGTAADAGGGASIAVGTRASTISTAGYNYQTALGVDTKSEANLATALGGKADAKASNSVALGANSVSDRANTVSVGSADATTGFTRQIANVAKGTLDNDAVNVSQLKGVTTAFGGGSAVNADGSIKAPSYTVNGNTYSDVGSAITAAAAASGTVDALKWNTTAGAYDAAHGAATTSKIVNVADGTLAAGSKDAVNGGQLNTTNTNVTNLSTTVNNITTGKAGLVQQSAAGAKLTVGAATDGTQVDFAGTAGARQLINVAAGAVSATSKDAINGSQLYGVSTSVTGALGGGSAVNPDGTITKPTYSVDGKSVVGVDGAVTALDNKVATFSDLAQKVKYIKFGYTTALDASASGTDSVAIGGFAQASGTGALAIGANARAMADNAVAIGAGSSTTAANTFAVGSSTAKRRIVNVADAVNVTDAVTLGQMNTKIAEALNGTTLKSGTMLKGSTLLGATFTSSLTPDKLIVSGPNGAATTPTDAIGDKAVAMGLNSHANANNAVAAGQNVSVLGANGVGVGQNIAVGGVSAVAIGATVSSVSDYATAIGSDGTEVNTGATGAVAIGRAVSVGGEGTVGIGSNIVATGKNAIVLGSSSSDDGRDNVVSVGSAGTVSGTTSIKRQIVNVKAGTLDTDAVNVSQLKGVTAALGGGTAVAADGSITKPTYDIAGSTYDTVGKALDAVEALAASGSALGVTYDSATKDKVTLSGTSGTTLTNLKDGVIAAGSKDAVTGNQLNTTNANVTNLSTTVNNITTGKAGLVQQSAAGAKLTVGAATDGTQVDFAGTAGARQLINVAAGAVSATSKDAINGSQLYATSNSVASALGGSSTINADGTVKAPTYTVSGTTYSNVGAALDAVAAAASTGSQLGVAYDTATKDKVTLSGTSGTTLTNLKDGAIAAGSKDAVTGNQLNTTNANVTNLSTTVNNITTGKAGLVQQSAAGAKLTVGATTDGTQVDFAGTAGARQLINVAAGAVSATSKDAINGSQLFATSKSVADALGGSSTVNADGTVKAPTYNLSGKTYSNVGDALTAIDAKAGSGSVLGVSYDDATKGAITLAGADGTTIGNVAAGVKDDQAVNVSQLKGIADAIGGGAAIDPTTGKTEAPSFSVTDADGVKQTVDNVGDAISTIDDTVSGLSGDVTNISNTVSTLSSDALKWNATTGTYSAAHGTQTESRISNVADAVDAKDAVNKSQLDKALSGIVSGNNPLAVTYDGSDKSTLTLGGTDATRLVQLKNVADGVEDHDAVNVGQLKDAGLIGPNGSTMDAVVYDANSAKGSVTFGGAYGTILNNVADGLITQDSRQAVNGGQIYQLKEQLNQQINGLDGRVTKLENGGTGGSAPYIAANPAGTDAKAPAQLGDNAGVAVGYNTDVKAGDSAAIGNGASVKENASNSVALGSGSVADTANTVSVGSEGHERTLSHVARGIADSDVATMGQMHETLDAANAYTDQRMNDVWSDLGNEINQVNRQANRGIAAASALINVTPYVPGHTTVNAGAASYRGEAALGVGVSRWSDNGRVNFNAGVSAAKNDEPVFRVGVGYIF